MNSLCEKWKSELDEVLSDVQHIAKNRKIYWALQEIVRANQKINKGSPIHDIMASGYLLSCLMALRRHVKVKKESISFMRILKEIKENPHELNMGFYRSLADEDWRKELLEKTFQKYVAPGKGHIDPILVEKDMIELKASFESSEAFADKKIAHLDKTPPSRTPKFKELEDAWDLFESLVIKYYLLLTGASLSSVAPIMQYDWKEVLRVAWIENEEGKNEASATEGRSAAV